MKNMKRPLVAAICVLLTVLFLAANLTALASFVTPGTGSAKNSPPIAKNLELTTFKNVAITERFQAVDPEGDLLTFEIMSAPKKGEVTLSEDGHFTYTPKQGTKGKDSFTYVAVDVNGNVSSEATVKIEIKKQSTKTTYADMDGNSAAYASLVLAENDVFTGEKLGDEYFFRPEQAVTRGEFLAMCLKAAGAETLTGVTRTGFSDDGEIPAWIKPYVSTALMSGVISGYKDTEGQLVFSSEAPVSFSEAAVILDNILNITDVVSVAVVQTDPAVPVWAYKATVNLSSCNIIPDGVSDMYGECVTRADAAKLLVASMDLIEARDGGKSLLGWAK